MSGTTSSLSATLLAARANRSILKTLGSEAPASLSDAYAAAMACMDGAPVAAWKLGGTTAATRAAFNVSSAYAGPLKAAELFDDGDQLDRANFIKPVVEPEIAVCFATSPYPGATPDIAWIAPALELPDTPLADPVELGVTALLADRCAAGALVIGQQMPVEHLTALEQADVELYFDDQLVSSAAAGAIIGGVPAAIGAFIALAEAQSLPIPPGTVVCTGGLCPAVALPSQAAQISVRLSDVASVSFEWR